MNYFTKYLLTVTCIVLVLLACSTEKNTLISRTYHGVNARYNGYFNANLLLDQAITSYRNNLKEDYYKLLPIETYPGETEVKSYYPAIDTAISKCKKVITDHSMPSNDRPSKKKEEHNHWIDENWITIGQAHFYRREYAAAIKDFQFVKKFYFNDPSLYVGELWMAKANIELGKLTEAKFNLDNLDKALEEGESGGKDESKKKTKSKSKKKEEEVKPAKFPKKIRFDFEKTKADLALRKGEKENAIKYLESALEHAKTSADRGRISFILGQLYEDKEDTEKAKGLYRTTMKANVPYEMAFNARLKNAFLSNSSDMHRQLTKMLRDAKNAEYKDQIYYTLANIELQAGNEPKGIEYLTQSAFFSSSNPRQKGMAYEKLGDLSFAKRNYIPAQKYYDSCAAVIPPGYPNEDGIRNKAAKLADLVVAVETAHYEDSVQRVAQMDESQRDTFLKDLIKKEKEEEQKRKERDAARLRELQANQNMLAQDQNSGSKWYWSNPKVREEGYQEFVRLWGGDRINEDNWRRSDKTSSGGTFVNEEDTTSTTPVEIDKDSLRYQQMLGALPLSDSALALSYQRMLSSFYNAGMIYKDQLNEIALAKTQFHEVLERPVASDFKLMSAYQLYRLYAGSDDAKANEQKQYILTNYPDSDYANYLKDPDYFIKKKEREALAEQEYVAVLERYNRGIYYPVLTKAEIVITEEKENAFRPKYMLLKAYCIGQTERDKKLMLPVLQQLLAEYPGTPEMVRGQQLIELINNGFSTFNPPDFSNKSIYEYEEEAKQLVIIFLENKDENVNIAKNKVSDFNREFFPKARLRVSSKIFGDNQNIILLQEFDKENDAKEYVRKYKDTRKYLLDLQNAKTIIITNKNMRILFETQKLEEYDIFYDEYY